MAVQILKCVFKNEPLCLYSYQLSATKTKISLLINCPQKHICVQIEMEKFPTCFELMVCFKKIKIKRLKEGGAEGGQLSQESA